MKTKKLFSLNDEAIDKLKKLSANSNLSDSAMVEALILTAPDDLKINISSKVVYNIETKHGDNYGTNDNK